ncbi:uncharacterized protein LOC118752916, partial [Rhagoletis pomonella]|uniref:uncharacterized protein LOC118752916 n=1 Tax=Rhagoletis pomonella TaxID=28610 RepID=UPI00177D3915
MQMDARTWRRCGCCICCGKFEAHRAYIKKNNSKLNAIQTAKATITTTTTTTATATQQLAFTLKTKAHSNHNNSAAAVRVISLAYQQRKAAGRLACQRKNKWPQTQLTFAAATGSCNHSRINVTRSHLTSVRFTLTLISYANVAFVIFALTELHFAGSYNPNVVVAFAATAAAGATIQQTQTHLPAANFLEFVVGSEHLPQQLAPLTTMGSCFGRCMAKDALGGGSGSSGSSTSTTTATSCLWRQEHATDEQEAELVSNASDKCPRENFIYRIIKFKTKQKRPQFIDKFWEQQDLQYTKLSSRNGTQSGHSDIQLQNLDVNNLLSNALLAKESALNYCLSEAQYAAASSRASSSLDLEWEHEYGHMRQLYQQSHNTHRSTQSLLLTAHNGGSNNNLAQYTNSNTTPVHQAYILNNNSNTLSTAKSNATYDNHPLHVHLMDDSWQYLSNDEDQLNSLASYSQSQSLPHAPLNAAAASVAAARS